MIVVYDLELEESPSYELTFNDVDITYDMDVDSSFQISNAETYSGEYEVIPKADEGTMLLTKNKLLTDNVTVTKIPYYETSNPDGVTVYIASEVN